MGTPESNLKMKKKEEEEGEEGEGGGAGGGGRGGDGVTGKVVSELDPLWCCCPGVVI